MVKKKRTRSPNLIKTRHSYTLKEIAEIYKLHPGTVQSWRKKGLKVIDEGTKPYLVIGEEIQRFLKERARKRKYPLKPGEFFCTKCRKPRRSHPDKLSVEITDKMLGKTCKKAVVKGVCEVCNQSFCLFSSDRKIQEWVGKGLLLLRHQGTIIGYEYSSVNTV